MLADMLNKDNSCIKSYRNLPNANKANRRPITQTRLILSCCLTDGVYLQLLEQKPGKTCTKDYLHERDWQATAPTKRRHFIKVVRIGQWRRTTHNLRPITAQSMADVVQSDSSTYDDRLKSWLATIGQEWIIRRPLPNIYPQRERKKENLSQRARWPLIFLMQLYTYH